MKSLVNFLIMLFLVASMVACGGKKQKEEEAAKQEEYDQQTEELKTISIFDELPDVNDVAATIHLSGADYVGGLINDPVNVEKYLELNEGIMAANVGIYYADMTYNAIYGKGELARQQYQAANTLAQKLGTARSLNQLVGERFKEQIENSDEARKLLNDSFVEANNNLRTGDRQIIALASATGWYIESLYILTNLIENYPTDLPEEARNTVLLPLVRATLEMEGTLGKLIQIAEELAPATTRADYFIYDLKDLKVSFENVDIEETVLNSNPSTVVTNDQLDEIAERAATIRRRLVEGTM